MNKILELREKRAKAWETAKAFLDTKRGSDGIVSAEDTAVYDKMEADVVALFLPGGSGTYHLLDARRIALMKKGAVLVNGGRGTAVDTDALTAALRTGSMGGAALDVTDPEPLPPGHPLWDMENVLITPHAAGGFSLPQTLDRIVEIAADNLRRYLAGEPLHNAVERGTLEKGEKE